MKKPGNICKAEWCSKHGQLLVKCTECKKNKCKTKALGRHKN